MIEEFIELLKKVSVGDESAIEKILQYSKESNLTSTEKETFHFYLNQTARQSHYAIYLRGLLYKYGYVVKQDFDMSFLLMREAASKGNAKAIYEVGHHFLEGRGVEKNNESALQWLKMAAGSPYYIPDAMYVLATMYEQGLGTDADAKKAEEWYTKAAQKGHLEAKAKLLSF